MKKSDFVVNKHKIFLDPKELVPIIEAHRKEGKVIVFGNGCFELIHVGHMRYLFGAKAEGDILIVAVNTDHSVSYIKPDRQPVNPDHERMELIASIEAVDYVIPLNDSVPNHLIEMLKPDVHTKGTDYTELLDKIPEKKVVESYGGRIVAVGDPKDHSTTHMLRSLQKNF